MSLVLPLKPRRTCQMKYFILFFALSSTLAQAQISQAHIKDFNFSYQDYRGEGMAAVFSFEPHRGPRTQQKVVVERIFDEFKISLSGVHNEELHLRDAPSIVLNAESMTLKDFNLSFSETFGLQMGSGIFTSSVDQSRFSELHLSCERHQSYKMVKEQMINGCLKKMTMKIGAFSTTSAFINKLMPAVDGRFDVFADSVDIKDFDVNMTNSSFDFVGELKALIIGKIKGKGSVGYSSHDNRLTINLNEVKFGFLNITSQVFDELKKQENDEMKVERPYIYVTIK